MKIECIKVGYLQTNCYILDINNQILVIDPGDEYDKIASVINNRKVIGCIVTHYHFDHIKALDHFSNIYDIYNLKEGVNTIGPFNFEIIYTPGHREDCITIYFQEEKIMFVGDFIFEDGIGRCDLEGGDMNMMVNSLRKISKYDNSITIYPGHGDKTKLGIEISKYQF